MNPITSPWSMPRGNPHPGKQPQSWGTVPQWRSRNVCIVPSLPSQRAQKTHIQINLSPSSHPLKPKAIVLSQAPSPPRRMGRTGSSPWWGLVCLQHSQLPQMLAQGAVPEASWTGPVTKHWMWQLHGAAARRPGKNCTLTQKNVPWLHTRWRLRTFCRRAPTKVALVCNVCNSGSKGASCPPVVHLPMYTGQDCRPGL